MRWNITNVKPYIRPTRKDAINVIAAHVLTHRSEQFSKNISINLQSPIRTFYTIALHEHVALFHALKLYSTDQFSFCLIRPDSIMCHFLVNNLRNRFRSPWSLCGSVVEHRSAESEGLRFDSSWDSEFFSLSHARDKTNPSFSLLHFSTYSNRTIQHHSKNFRRN